MSLSWIISNAVLELKPARTLFDSVPFVAMYFVQGGVNTVHAKGIILYKLHWNRSRCRCSKHVVCFLTQLVNFSRLWLWPAANHIDTSYNKAWHSQRQLLSFNSSVSRTQQWEWLAEAPSQVRTHTSCMFTSAWRDSRYLRHYTRLLGSVPTEPYRTATRRFQSSAIDEPQRRGAVPPASRAWTCTDTARTAAEPQQR